MCRPLAARLAAWAELFQNDTVAQAELGGAVCGREGLAVEAGAAEQRQRRCVLGVNVGTQPGQARLVESVGLGQRQRLEREPTPMRGAPQDNAKLADARFRFAQREAPQRFAASFSDRPAATRTRQRVLNIGAGFAFSRVSGVAAIELHLGIAKRDKQRCRIGELKRAQDDAVAGKRRRGAHASAFARSLARTFTLSLRSWPQAARMSRPRGVRIGEE
jgi:hypothetical protein